MFTLDGNLQVINYLHFVSNKDLSGAHIILQGLVQTTKTNPQLKTLVCFFWRIIKGNYTCFDSNKEICYLIGTDRRHRFSEMLH